MIRCVRHIDKKEGIQRVSIKIRRRIHPHRSFLCLSVQHQHTAAKLSLKIVETATYLKELPIS